ncbi:MAG: ABC transporter substrate-binding protein [Chloroflexi bacterium]|nr:ABC transporter substrate-binding protein [Chloroflexota bacterium]
MAYDTASGNILENVMEGLIYYNHKDATSYVPQLALEVPSVANGGISEDGLTYTFNIREGVTFHDGGTLTPAMWLIPSNVVCCNLIPMARSGFCWSRFWVTVLALISLKVLIQNVVLLVIPTL